MTGARGGRGGGDPARSGSGNDKSGGEQETEDKEGPVVPVPGGPGARPGPPLCVCVTLPSAYEGGEGRGADGGADGGDGGPPIHPNGCGRDELPTT